MPTQLIPADPAALDREVDALEPLRFELVFLDDKSFGEAKNWRELGRVRDRLMRTHPDFTGFIIQTPPSLAAKPGFLAECRNLGVRYVEFGVEAVDDKILRYLRKPFRVRHLTAACEEARRLGLYVIPNLIMGIPGDDYAATISWVEDNVDIIPVVNVNWLAVHYGNERGDLGLPAERFADRDQNSMTKTWLTDDQVRVGKAAIDHIYAVTDQFWRERTTRSPKAAV